MNYYEEIKNKIIDNEIYSKVKDYSKERNTVNTYFEIGRLLSEVGKKYGEGIINEYSENLTLELGKGYNVTNLKRYRQLIQKGARIGHQLSWSHYYELV